MCWTCAGICGLRSIRLYHGACTASIASGSRRRARYSGLMSATRRLRGTNGSSMREAVRRGAQRLPPPAVSTQASSSFPTQSPSRAGMVRQCTVSSTCRPHCRSECRLQSRRYPWWSELPSPPDLRRGIPVPANPRHRCLRPELPRLNGVRSALYAAGQRAAASERCQGHRCGGWLAGRVGEGGCIQCGRHGRLLWRIHDVGRTDGFSRQVQGWRCVFRPVELGDHVCRGRHRS